MANKTTARNSGLGWLLVTGAVFFMVSRLFFLLFFALREIFYYTSSQIFFYAWVTGNLICFSGMGL